ncbi:hypothetical protein AWC05_27155 [Mycobacterium florentinum]|uniref:YbjN domain-containing protein n=1 Tax=Mycobacterium florentinum TaxID=292462 RepID=A0A1X1U343_MYCFL|nr:hypothetical protein [Mycobacterium florentinum]MCV7411082.1 hypothetical protein [Mycobacterium florentinum]ORV51262.1 hypothetical protein AWC05_27155 [Mycobacterium florentinum]BBX80427.1 hypothetical protein MFLOJ_42140 [Mycobacterium florentinum]
MTTYALSADLIERYLCTRGSRYFRGQHDGEFFYVANTRPRRLHVHLGISRWHRDEFTIQVTPGCFFPAADGAELAELADSWNSRSRDVLVTVRGSSDPQRVGVVARSSRKIREPVAFDDFATYIDHSIAAAIEFFADLDSVAECPAEPLVLDAG